MSANYILESYLRRLTNLSGNNRSLLLLRLPAEQLMDVNELGFLNGDKSFEIIRSLIAGADRKLCQVLDSRHEPTNVASAKLKQLQRIDRFIFDERGSNDLHIGWPFVRGKFSDGTLVRCPLLFFPVSLVQQGSTWVLQERKDAGVTFNKSFLLGYSFYNGVKVDEELLDTTFDDFDPDSTVFRTQLYQLLKDRIEINFNPDNFLDELSAFREFRKDEFEELHRNGELKLFPEAVLGIFPQAGSQLVPDYLQLLERDTTDDLETFFAAKHYAATDNGRTLHDAVKEEKLFTPFVVDAYQENAIRAVKNGHSLVVQGPPGTGKSQLICNLLADAIASGKRALLVCQKRAALDVVYERMKEKDLADFLGLVHDFRNDRKTIFAKVARQVDRIDEYKVRNRSIDVIQTERRFVHICRRIDQITEELEEFRKALFHDEECGLSAKELYLTSNPRGEQITIRQEYHYFMFGNVLQEFIRKLHVYAQYARQFDADNYVWRERRSFAALQPRDEQIINDIIRDIPAYQKAVEEDIFRLIGVNRNLEECESFLHREEEVLGMTGVLKDDDTFRYMQAMIQEEDDETSLLWLSNVERVCMLCFDGEKPEITIPSEQLGQYQEALHERVSARGNIFRRIRWEFFSKTKMLVKRALVANELNDNAEGLEILEQRIDSRLNLEHHLTSLKERSWLIDLPLDYDQERLRKWFERQKLAIRAKLVFHTLREVKNGITVQKLSRKEFITLLHKLLEAVRGIPAKKEQWLRYLAPYQLRQLILNPAMADEYSRTLRADFDNLAEFDKLREGLAAHERDVIVKLYDAIQAWDAPALESLFQNSLRLAWLDHIETKYPQLRAVSSMKMDDLQRELQQFVEEKHNLSQEILLVKARERVYEDVTYNRLNNRVTYRDLYHQVTKKKKIWPVRKVVSEFNDELFRLVPCWMASPESVSAIFPMTELFDLVIFDEASQCFAERGIPAMYRGKQVVVAGDDQQLKPNELYQVRWEDDSELPDLEAESLLELSARYLSTVHLQGHYRSRSLELIAFSNQHFYENRLRLLPDHCVMNDPEPPIEYCKVDGVWEKQTNEVEARTVTERVFGILAEHPMKEIGVVTFNAPQQMLILDMLEAEALRLGKQLPPSVFVKNIENVQGDEKDIIIFSVGYAPDKKGKLAMLFGTLNAAGGENRLNVAVTRARERIILITSIWPEQLATEGSKNAGPDLLRKYLAFARDVWQRRFAPAVPEPSRQSSSWYLSTHLQKWGAERLGELTFETDTLPFSDVNVRQADRYAGIILTDDLRYLQSVSVKDAYAYTPALLARKNWRYRMVYSRNYWKDVERVERELMLFIGNQL